MTLTANVHLENLLISKLVLVKFLDLSVNIVVIRHGTIDNVTKIFKTRMVQLPATAAIEYVAACWVSGDGGIIVRGCFWGVFGPSSVKRGWTHIVLG